MWLPFFFFSFPFTDLISINPANTFMVRILASSGDFSLRECYACRTSAFAFWLCYDLMVVCSVRNPIQQRRWPPENSYQWHEVTKGKKEKTQDLTRFGNSLTSSGQDERVLFESINYRLQVFQRLQILGTLPLLI